jgi:hypothetical protein
MNCWHEARFGMFIAIECDAEPTQDNIFVRNQKPRDGV